MPLTKHEKTVTMDVLSLWLREQSFTALSNFKVQIDTFGKWLRCLKNVCYVIIWSSSSYDHHHNIIMINRFLVQYFGVPSMASLSWFWSLSSPSSSYDHHHHMIIIIIWSSSSYDHQHHDQQTFGAVFRCVFYGQLIMVDPCHHHCDVIIWSSSSYDHLHMMIIIIWYSILWSADFWRCISECLLWPANHGWHPCHYRSHHIIINIIWSSSLGCFTKTLFQQTKLSIPPRLPRGHMAQCPDEFRSPPPKFWRLVGCIKLWSLGAKTKLRSVAFQPCIS